MDCFLNLPEYGGTKKLAPIFYSAPTADPPAFFSAMATPPSPCLMAGGSRTAKYHPQLSRLCRRHRPDLSCSTRRLPVGPGRRTGFGIYRLSIESAVWQPGPISPLERQRISSFALGPGACSQLRTLRSTCNRHDLAGFFGPESQRPAATPPSPLLSPGEEPLELLGPVDDTGDQQGMGQEGTW